MPRISKKNRAELLEALYNSDSDDDDDLLMSNVHLQPSQRSPDSSVDKSPPKLLSRAPVESKEKFEERGKKQKGKQSSRIARFILIVLNSPFFTSHLSSSLLSKTVVFDKYLFTGRLTILSVWVVQKKKIANHYNVSS
jgi:hypothetical protein